MASMSPEIALMIFMTPIFTDNAKLALEVFNGLVGDSDYHGRCSAPAMGPTRQKSHAHCF